MSQEHYDPITEKMEELEEMCSFNDLMSFLKDKAYIKPNVVGFNISLLEASGAFEFAYGEFLEAIAERLVDLDEEGDDDYDDCYTPKGNDYD